MPLPGDTLGGRYDLRAVQGRGGHATVFRAYDQWLHRDVAVKVFERGAVADEAVGAKVLEEARHLAALRHPNVVAVHDADADDGHAFLVLDLVDGPSLARRLGMEGPPPVETCARLIGEIAEGLEAIHRLGIAHRDVKPGNVLLTGDGRAVVADFGLARLTQSDRTTTVTVRGSVSYVAPERLTGQPADERCDVYALACVAMELLTGRPPFSGPTPSSVAEQHVHAQPPSARARRPELPEAVDDVLRWGLAKHPDRRPASARLFALRLADALAGRDVSAVVPHGAPPSSVLGVPSARSDLPGRVVVAAVAVLVAAGVLLDALTGADGADVKHLAWAVADLSAPGDVVAAPSPHDPALMALLASTPGVAPDAPPPDDAPPPRRSDDAAAVDAADTAEAAVPTRPSVDQAAHGFMALLDQGVADGRAHRRAHRDLRDRLRDLMRDYDRGRLDRAEDRVDGLAGALDRWVARGRLDADLANLLAVHLDDLAAAMRRGA